MEYTWICILLGNLQNLQAVNEFLEFSFDLEECLFTIISDFNWFVIDDWVALNEAFAQWDKLFDLCIVELAGGN